jgi:hypothetical protein
MAEGRKHALTGRQRRFLFARGILRGVSSGGKRKVIYQKAREAGIAAGKAIANSAATVKRIVKGTGLSVRPTERKGGGFLMSGSGKGSLGKARMFVRGGREASSLMKAHTRDLARQAVDNRQMRIAAGRSTAARSLERMTTRQNGDIVAINSASRAVQLLGSRSQLKHKDGWKAVKSAAAGYKRVERDRAALRARWK